MTDLSVIVCSHSRPDDLRSCLGALARLDERGRVEVLVVDSASSPSLESVVGEFQSPDTSVRYFREELPGLSRARNRGVREAGSRVIAFVDDDAAPRVDWAVSLLKAFDDESVGCVGGACVARFAPATTPPRWLSPRLLQFAGITNFGSVAREARSSAEWPFGANIAFRREALPSDTPFSEQLGRIGTSLLSGEESELVERVRQSHWRIWLEPAAVVDHTVHPARCTSRYYWRRLWWNGVSRAQMKGRWNAGARLIVAAPIRLGLYLVTRDRVHLYRTAETAGFLFTCLRRGKRSS